LVILAAGCGKSATVTAQSAPDTDRPTAATTVPVTQPRPTTTAPKPTTTAPCASGSHKDPSGSGCVPNTTTTAEPTKGSRQHPFDLNQGDELSIAGTWTSVTFSGPEDVDPATIIAANQFNDEAPDGQIYLRVLFTGVFEGTDTMSGTSAAHAFKLVGDQNTVYNSAFVSDSHDVLNALSEQPDVISGGTLGGYIYYLVSADDANLMILNKGSTNQFIIPLATP
jgi:hypothetical protein